VSLAPLRMFHGSADDYVSVAPCRDFVAALKAAGANVLLTEFPETWHAFDTPTLPRLYLLAKAQSTRNCRLKEGPNGTILNAATMAPYSVKTDPCAAPGAHVGYNPEATAAAHEAITALVRQVLLN
jgi:dienelactone hydrolase